MSYLNLRHGKGEATILRHGKGEATILRHGKGEATIKNLHFGPLWQ